MSGSTGSAVGGGRDPYREVDRLGAAPAAVGGGCDGGTVHRVVAHQFWYAWCQARNWPGCRYPAR
jgi:hypothetical protein